MKNLLKLSNNIFPYQISKKNLYKTLPKEKINLLIKLEVLQKTDYLKHYECPDCFNLHEIVFKNNTTAFIVCPMPDIGRNYIDIKKIMQYQFNIFNLIEKITKALEITYNIKEIIKNELWEIGHTNNKYRLFYSCSYRLSEHQDKLKEFTDNSQVKNLIIFTNTKKPLMDKVACLIVPICDIAILTAKKIEISKDNFYKKLNYFKTQTMEQDNKILECSGLKLDLTKGTLQYKNNTHIEINTENQPIKFLKLLIKNKDTVIKYKDIGRTLNLPYFHENILSKDIARDIQDIKKKLRKILIKTGLTKKTFSSLIKNVRSIGFKISS